MKKILALALLGTLPLVAPVQAQESASFTAWSSNHGTTLNVEKQRKPLKHAPSQQRPHLDRYTRPTSLQQAGDRLERLERRHDRLENDLRRALRYHASRSHIRSLRNSLRRVNENLRVAKRDYQRFLKRAIGARPYRQLLQHAAWLSNQRPHQQTGHGRPSWRD